MHRKRMAFSLVLHDFGVRPGNSRTSSYSTACALYFKLRSVAFRVPPNHEPGTSISTHRSTCSGPGYCLTNSTNLAIASRPPSIASRPPPPAIASRRPLVGLQPKGQVSVLCNLGLAERALQLRTAEVFAHDVLGSVGDRDLRLCVGVRIADGVCNKRFARRTVHVRGMREEGGRRETHEYLSSLSSTSEPASSPLSALERSAATFNAFLSALFLFLLPGLNQHSPACILPQCSHGLLAAASFCKCANSRFAPAPCPPRGGRVLRGVCFRWTASFSFTIRST
jgi:hypothetical protein